jgi:hypothetical protein
VSDQDKEAATDGATDGDVEGDAANAATDEYDGFLFRWRDTPDQGRGFALALFVGVALLVHAVGFYFFQVNAPVSSRVEARTARVTMLDSSDAATAALLREVDDRLVFLRPASLGTGSRLRIEDYAVTFQPSFLEGEVAFRGPSERPMESSLLAEMVPRNGLVLPPVAKLPEDASAEAGNPLAPKIAGATDDESSKALEQEKQADLVVNYSTAGDFRVKGSEQALAPEEAAEFFDQQSKKDFLVVIVAKNTWSEEQLGQQIEKLRNFFVARGYRKISIQQGLGGGRGIHLEHSAEESLKTLSEEAPPQPAP